MGRAVALGHDEGFMTYKGGRRMKQFIVFLIMETMNVVMMSSRRQRANQRREGRPINYTHGIVISASHSLTFSF
jgi:hypothetical protein